MSWKASAMSQRLEFVRLASVEGQEFKEACSRFGISRKTGYKWLKRFSTEGEAGLVDRSRRPKGSPGKSSRKVEAMVVKLRKKNPVWGGRKLQRRLLDDGRLNVPSASTITSILGRHGLLSELDGAGVPRGPQRFERDAPNELWQMDFKGHFGMVGGGRCHPLTVLDDHSRYSIGLRACGNEQGTTVMQELVGMFRVYGLPVQMLMDNGSPWGDEGGQPWTIVTSWLVRLGIRVTHIVDSREKSFSFLGYSFRGKLRFPREKSHGKFVDRLRELTPRKSGESMETTIQRINRSVQGWFNYFRHCHWSIFREYDRMIRRRLRRILLKRNRRNPNRIPRNQRWPDAYFTERGLISLNTAHMRFVQHIGTY